MEGQHIIFRSVKMPTFCEEYDKRFERSFAISVQNVSFYELYNNNMSVWESDFGKIHKKLCGRWIIPVPWLAKGYYSYKHIVVEKKVEENV